MSTLFDASTAAAITDALADAKSTTVFVAGKPAPQGSKKAIINRFTGHAAVVESSNERLNAWRSDVRDAILTHRPAAPLLCPMTVKVEFVMPRPTSMPKTKATPPHTKRPDIDKLARGLLDAMDSAGLWGDDSQVTSLVASKRTAELGETPGAHITWTELA